MVSVINVRLGNRVVSIKVVFKLSSKSSNVINESVVVSVKSLSTVGGTVVKLLSNSSMVSFEAHDSANKKN